MTFSWIIAELMAKVFCVLGQIYPKYRLLYAKKVPDSIKMFARKQEVINLQVKTFFWIYMKVDKYNKS